MKKCPYCAEEIQDEAIKCKHCGSSLPGSSHLTSKKAQARQEAIDKFHERINRWGPKKYRAIAWFYIILGILGCLTVIGLPVGILIISIGVKAILAIKELEKSKG